MFFAISLTIGVFYLLVIEQNKPTEIMELMKLHGFECEIIKKKKAFNERLQIMKFTRVTT